MSFLSVQETAGVGGRHQTPFFSRVKPQQAPPGHAGPSPVPTGSGQENALQRWRHGQPSSSDPARPRQCGPLPPALHAPTGRSTSSLHADTETPRDVTFWDHVSHSERPGSGPKCQWPSCSCTEFSEPIKDTGHPGTQLDTWTWLEGPLCLWHPQDPPEPGTAADSAKGTKLLSDPPWKREERAVTFASGRGGLPGSPTARLP